jgi:hypothetical protein
MNALREAQNGAQAFAAEELEFMEIEDHAFASGAEETAAVGIQQARSGGVNATLGGDHFGIFQLSVGELQHGSLLSPACLYYPPWRSPVQPGNG